jgi:hypothetical protein
MICIAHDTALQISATMICQGKSRKSCRKIYTIFYAVLRQQTKSDVMTSFGHSACSAVYYQAGSPLRCSAKSAFFTTPELPSIWLT